MGPADCTCNGRHVARYRRIFIKLVNLGAAVLICLVSDLKISLVELQKGNLLLLKLILDNFSGEKTLKAFKELEFSHKGVTVIEGSGEHRGKTSLELLDSLSELEEVIRELLLLNIHDIVVDEHEVLDSGRELCLNGHNGRG